MSTEFKLPELGENIASATVVGVLVSAGDVITEGQGIIEVETDKAVIEVPSALGGTVTAVHISEGQEITIDQLLLTIDESAAAPAPAAKADPAAPTKPAAAPVAVPAAAPVAAPASPPAPPAVKAAPAPPPPPAPPAPAPVPSAPASDDGNVAASPAVRRFARELGVDAADVAGTGPSGRVTMDDVKTHVRAGSYGAGRAPAPQPLPDFSRFGPVRREAMSNVRRATARNLGQSWPTLPMVTQFDKADITDLEQLRKTYGPRVQSAGAKLTPTAIILKVIAGALKRFPKFNASIDMENEEVVFKEYINVAVAVDTDRGLLVPVIRDVDQKNITQLSLELGEMAQKARDRKLSLDDMQGAGFTISNLGGIGGTAFTPLVNAPEVAILGVARGSTEPVFVDGQFVPRLMMPLTLTYDHRLIDGADAARFLRWVCEALENPLLLALEG